MILLHLLQVFPGGRRPADRAGVCHQHVLCGHLCGGAPQRVALRASSIPLRGLPELRGIPGGSSDGESLARPGSRLQCRQWRTAPTCGQFSFFYINLSLAVALEKHLHIHVEQAWTNYNPGPICNPF